MTSLKNLILLGAHILIKCIVCATVVLKRLDLLLFKVPFLIMCGETMCDSLSTDSTVT